MTHQPGNSNQARARLLVVASLLLALVALTAANGIAHFHSDFESAASCRICQIVHISTVRMTVQAALPEPVAVVYAMAPEVQALYFEPFLHPSQARAPPA